jgi:hypothetical protein
MGSQVVGIAAAFVFFAVCFAGAGLGLQRLFRLPPDPALVLPLGGAATAGAFWLSLVTRWPWLFPMAILGLAVAALRPGPARSHLNAGRGLWLTGAAIVAVLGLTVYPLHRVDGEGQFLLDGESALAADTAFHVGVTHELDLGYPPQVPGLAGFPLRYHLGTDLVRAAALRWAGVGPYDSINRLDVTLWALAVLLTVRGLAGAIGGAPLAMTLAGLALVAGDFSFLFAGNPQAHWWTDLLRGNLLLSLAYANPVMPALAMAMGCLIALAHHRDDGRTGWLWIAGAQAFAVAFFKVFLGAHLALGLAVAGALRRDRRALMLAATAGLSTSGLALASGGAHGVDISVAPLDLVNVTRETLALPVFGGWSLAAWATLWLFASLGLRWLGVGPALAAMRGPTHAAALAVMALSGWPLGLLFKVAPPDAVAGQRPINDASFFVEQSGPLLWIFAAMTLARLAERHSRPLVLGLAALLALPSTVHFVVKKAGQAPHAMPAATVRAMTKLAEASAPGEVILQRPRKLYPPPPVILIGRRVPLDRFMPYLTQFAPKDDVERRHEAVFRFFERAGAAEAREIARTLGTRYLCLYEGEPRPQPEVVQLYEKVYEEPGVGVYRLRGE